MGSSRSGSSLDKRPREEGEIDEREEAQRARRDAPPPPPPPPPPANLDAMTTLVQNGEGGVMRDIVQHEQDALLARAMGKVGGGAPVPPPQTMNLSELNMADLENVQSKKELPPFKFPEHREPGRAGRQCRVKCNAVALKPRRALIFYQYDVAFWFNQGGVRDEVPEGLAKMLLLALAELFGQNQVHHSSGERW